MNSVSIAEAPMREIVADRPPRARATRGPTVLVAVVLLASLAFCVYRIAPVFIKSRATDGDQFSTRPTQAQWALAMRELDEHRPEKAAAYIQKSLGIEADQAQRALLQGRLFLEARKSLAARNAFREAQDNERLALLATYWLGVTSYSLGDMPAAENYWLDVLEVSPHDVNTHRSLAVLYYDRGAIAHAVHHLKAVTTEAPDDSRPYRLLGLIHKDYEQYGEAIGFYRAALERQLTVQTREEVRHELAECLIKTRQYQAGLDVLKDASATYEVRVLKAECLIGLSRSDEAAGMLDEVLASDPKRADALVARAGIYLEQQQYDRAVEALRQAVAVQPLDYLANFRLAQALRSQGNPDEAATVAERAEEIKGKFERFSKLHQEATEKPLDTQVRVELGQLASELNLPEMAAVWYKAALDLDPQNQLARQKLDELSK